MGIAEKIADRYPQLVDPNGDADCGKGWHGLVLAFCEKIKDTGVKIAQIKEKFGLLRIYTEPPNSTAEIAADAAEAASAKICEGCGTHEGVTTEGGWLKTLCPKCRSKKHWWLDE